MLDQTFTDRAMAISFMLLLGFIILTGINDYDMIDDSAILGIIQIALYLISLICFVTICFESVRIIKLNKQRKAGQQ